MKNDYMTTLQEICDSELPAEEKLKLLNELYAIKPVRLDWYVAKASVILKEGKDIGRVSRILQGKFISSHDYEGIAAVQKIYQSLDHRANDPDMVQFRDYFISRLRNDKIGYTEIEEKVKKKEVSFLNNEDADLKSLASKYLTCGKWLPYYILGLCDHKNTMKTRKWIENLPNMGYLKECIEQKKKAVVCISDLSTQKEAYILGKCLAELGCPVWVISPPMAVEAETAVALEDTLPVSMGNAEKLYDFTLIPSLEIIVNGKSIGTNQAVIMNELCGEENSVLVLADSGKFEEFSRHPLLHNRIENLTGYQEGFRELHFAFGWAGSYLEYISQLHAFDVKTAIYCEPECKFSIVIPVRNSAATLQYTLQTCLNQRYKNPFEIIISDNSEENNTEVYRFYQTVRDKRVKYFRTPRNLNLSHSFEFAFLQARGEYVFSLGADDGVLPWALEALAEVVEMYPDEEVLQWERGFYAWPGFNKGQENQFCIPAIYEKDSYRAEHVEPIRYLSQAINNTSMMYCLPMLYINSCFKRSFLQTLLKETGRLWDGICQDLYMGTIISVIKERIVYIHYPLTIAGMSDNSSGAISTLPMENHEKGAAYERRASKESNIGGFSKSRMETLMPELGSDVTSLYNSILRAVNRGLMPAHYLRDVFDWKQWFLNSYKVMSKKDIYFDRKIHQMRYAAMKHGEAFLKWFDENIFMEALTPVVYEETENPERIIKTYQEINDGNQIVLDASKYDVHNVYEASLLFERLTGL